MLVAHVARRHCLNVSSATYDTSQAGQLVDIAKKRIVHRIRIQFPCTKGPGRNSIQNEDMMRMALNGYQFDAH